MLDRPIDGILENVPDKGLQSSEGGVPLATDFVERCARDVRWPWVERPQAHRTQWAGNPERIPEASTSKCNRSPEHCCHDCQVKCEKVLPKGVAASGAAEQFRRYGTSGLMPGVRRVRTSSSATRISLMLLSWETRRITLKAWSASIL